MKQAGVAPGIATIVGSILLGLVAAAPLLATTYPTPTCTIVHFTSPKIGWIVGSHGVYKSLDGGRTWTWLKTLPKHIFLHLSPPPPPQGGRPLSPDELEEQSVDWALGACAAFFGGERFLLGFGVPGSLLRTVDGGATWNNLFEDGTLNLPAGSPETAEWGCLRAGSLDRDRAYVVLALVSDLDGILRGPFQVAWTDDAGASFRVSSSNIAPLAVRGETLWLSVEQCPDRMGRCLLHSTDRGADWSEVNRWSSGNQRLDLTPDSLWILDQRPNHELILFRSQDFGRSLVESTLRLPFPGAEGVQFHDALHGWVWIFGSEFPNWSSGATSPKLALYRTRDGGLTWDYLIHEVPCAESVELFFLDTMLGWMVASSRSKGIFDVYRTIDGGSRWDLWYMGTGSEVAETQAMKRLARQGGLTGSHACETVSAFVGGSPQ